MKKVIELIGEVLFPKTCLSCRRLGDYICTHCARSLPVVTKDICPYCAEGSYLGYTHPNCKRKLGVDGLLSFFYYNNQTRKIIKEIKYRAVIQALFDLLHIISSDRIALIRQYVQSPTLGIAVPLHPRRLRERGFNQAQEITQFFCSSISVPYIKTLVRRVKNTTSQARAISHKQRYTNMLGAFAICDKDADIAQKNYIIFDDVWTTGSTIKELARVLKRSGAVKVFAVTLSR